MGDPLTLGWERNLIAFCTCSSLIGSEFTNTDFFGISFEDSKVACDSFTTACAGSEAVKEQVKHVKWNFGKMHKLYASNRILIFSQEIEKVPTPVPVGSKHQYDTGQNLDVKRLIHS